MPSTRSSASGDANPAPTKKLALTAECTIADCTAPQDIAAAPYCSLNHASIDRALHVADDPALAAAPAAAASPEPTYEATDVEATLESDVEATLFVPIAPSFEPLSSDDEEADVPGPAARDGPTTDISNAPGPAAPTAEPWTSDDDEPTQTSTQPSSQEELDSLGLDLNEPDPNAKVIDIMSIARTGVIMVTSMDPSCAIVQRLLRNGLLERVHTTVKVSDSCFGFRGKDDIMIYSAFIFNHRQRPDLPSPLATAVAKLLCHGMMELGVTVNVHQGQRPLSALFSAKTFAKQVASFKWTNEQVATMQDISTCFVPDGDDAVAFLERGRAENAAYAAEKAGQQPLGFNFIGPA
jgi:hypothetical protein